MCVVVVIECTAVSNLPVQLAELFPSTVASLIEEMCEMRPGVPWSVKVLDDMMLRMETNGMIETKFEFSPPHLDISKIEVCLSNEHRKVKRESYEEIHAAVVFFNGKTLPYGCERGGRIEKSFPKLQLLLRLVRVTRDGMHDLVDQFSVHGTGLGDCVGHFCDFRCY